MRVKYGSGLGMLRVAGSGSVMPKSIAELTCDKSLARLEDIYRHVEKRLTGIEERLGAVENQVDYLRAEMGTDFRKLRNEMNTHRSEMNAQQNKVNTRFYLLIGLIIVINLTASYFF
jgi:predicted  nucleic acid-binding Zn-ribbon protein